MELPCRSAEVKIFSAFLCQRCREIWREILVKFSALRFPGFGRATENFTKISRQKRCEKTENFMQISLCWGGALIRFPWRGDARESRYTSEKGPAPPTLEISALKGVSHFQLPLGRCHGTGGCRSYTVACRAAVGRL